MSQDSSWRLARFGFHPGFSNPGIDEKLEEMKKEGKRQLSEEMSQAAPCKRFIYLFKLATLGKGPKRSVGLLVNAWGGLIEANSDFAFCIRARLPSGKKPSLSTKRQNSFWKKNPGGNKESLSIWLESFWTHKSSQRKVDNLYRFMILIPVHYISSYH